MIKQVPLTLFFLFFLIHQPLALARPELCESSHRQIEKLNLQLQMGTALKATAKRIKTLSLHCREPLTSIQLTAKDLEASMVKGEQQEYQHTMALLQSGVRVDPSVVRKQESRLKYSRSLLATPNSTPSGHRSKYGRPQQGTISESSCESVDLRPQLGAIRDQGALSWCQSMVLADLLSYELKQEISAAAIGYLYSWDRLTNNSHQWHKTFYLEDGSIEGAFATLRANPSLCRESQISSVRPLSAMERIIKTFHEQTANSSDSLIQSARPIKDLQKLFPGFAETSLESVIKTSDPRSFFKNLSAAACQDNLAIPSSLQLKRADSRLLNTINQVLDNNHLPTVYYDQSFLYDPRPQPDLPNHLSILVGRRWNSEMKRCEFLLRNSHGPECEYSEHFECDAGSVWIPSDYLNLMTKRVYWLE